MSYFDQSDYQIRCEWGLQGVTTLAPHADVVIIVDVLSFSTAVDIAVSRGASVYPHRHRDESAAAYAQQIGGVLAQRDRSTEGFSLSPGSLVEIPIGTRLVLPSPNGATLSLATGSTPTFAACLRNATVVAGAATALGSRIAVIPAGERWRDNSLRPSLEDLIGAGAVIDALPAELERSAEAEAAQQTFRLFKDRLHETLKRCGSGLELADEKFSVDVYLAAQLDVSLSIPRLRDGAYRDG
jgi:2-phosphosulfolactate phosphatase